MSAEIASNRGRSSSLKRMFGEIGDRRSRAWLVGGEFLVDDGMLSMAF